MAKDDQTTEKETLFLHFIDECKEAIPPLYSA